ncbi:MAG: flagellar M-ring protein FliF [Bdellovibrionales bacterium]|nr:flagellar M-ring protein FliF [Bdellovibrionales bacterium]
MNKVIGSLLSQLKEYLKNLTPIKRASMIMASLSFVVAIVVIALMLTKATYVPLLKNIPADQLAVVLDKLQKNNIPFSLIEDGKTISVPQELLHSAQMVMMSELGSSSAGSIGLEIFEKQDFGVTSYAQRVNYQRALQGELMRAINSLSAVKRSKVILALPAKKTFLEEGGQASASVVVDLHPGKTMSADQVKGVTFLVSSSVEGLEAEDVTVVDSRGKVLSRATDLAAMMSSEFFDVQRRIEMELENRIETILSKVVGGGKVIARANVKLNEQNTSIVEESVDPDRTAVRSSVVEEESLDGARRNPAGVPGARANLPGAEDNGEVGFQQNVKKSLTTTNFSVPKTVKNIQQKAGAIDRISVAVLVDGKTQYSTNEQGERVEEYVPRTEEELQKYKEIVQNAVGFVDTRGDSISIENMQFQKESFEEAEKLLEYLDRKKLISAIFKWSLIGFSLALFFFIVIRPFMRWITDSFQDTVEDMLPRTIEELEELQSVDNSLPGMSSAMPVLEESLDPDKAESELLKERIMNLIEKDDEKAGGAFSLWLVRKDL